MQELRTLTAQLDSAQLTSTGFLRVSAVLASAKVYNFGPGRRERLTKKALFSPVALGEWEGAVVTLGHPQDELGRDVPVTAENARQFGVGSVHDPKAGTRSGEDVLKADLVITDAQAIRSVMEGQRELSIGAFFGLAAAADGDAEADFDVTAVSPNHVSIEARGLCGSVCSMLSADRGAEEEMACQECAELRTAADEAKELRTAADKARAERDAYQAQLDAYKASEGERFHSRLALMSEARKYLGADYQGAPTEREIKSEVVAKVLPALKGQLETASEDYVNAVYDAAMASNPRQASAKRTADQGEQMFKASLATASASEAEEDFQPPSLEELRLRSCARQSGCSYADSDEKWDRFMGRR